MAEERDDRVLDYAAPTPPKPLKRRDSMEYYREPPEWSGAVVWAGAVLGIIVIYMILACAGIVRPPVG